MSHELLFFFQSALWGGLLVFFYDVLRIGRRLVPRRALLVGAEDLLYWFAAGIFLFGKMYQENEGRIRGYAVAAVILGMTLYSCAISGKFVSVSVKILRVPVKFLDHLKKRLLFGAEHCKILVSKGLRSLKSEPGGRFSRKRRKRGGSVEKKRKGRVHTAEEESGGHAQH